MNKKTLISTLATMSLLLTGIVLPQSASAHEKPAASVDRYVAWHKVHSRHHEPDFRHYRDGYRAHDGRHHKPGLVRKLMRELDRRDRWAHLSPRERRLLKRELRLRKTHRKEHRRGHRRAHRYDDYYRGQYRGRHDGRIGLHLEYDKRL